MRTQGNRDWLPTSENGVYLRRSGAYTACWRDARGNQRKKNVRTIAEGARLRRAMIAEADRGELRLTTKITFAEYATTWIDNYTGRTTRGLRDSTRRRYRRDLELDAIPYFGKMRLGAIEPQDVRGFLDALAARGIAAATIRNILAPVRALFATAVEEGLIRSNPASRVRLPVADTAIELQPKALTPEELARLIAETAAEWRLLVRFLAQTGLRFSEMAALTWADVDLEHRRIHVRRALVEGDYVPPKSKMGRRTVPIALALAHDLAGARDHRRARDEDPVFSNRNGRPVDYRNLLHRVMKPAARRADVPWAAFHTLRHTCATTLFRHGYNAKQVQVWLGHGSPAFTLATYVHLGADDLPDPTFFDTPSENSQRTDPPKHTETTATPAGLQRGHVRIVR